MRFAEPSPEFGIDSGIRLQRGWDLSEKDRLERLEVYRNNADAAERQAERTTDPVLRRSLRKLADGWTVLADQLEAQLAAPAPVEELKDDRQPKPN